MVNGYGKGFLEAYEKGRGVGGKGEGEREGWLSVWREGKIKGNARERKGETEESWSD